MRIITQTKDRDDLMKYYSFDYKTISSPKDFANISAIQGLTSSISEMVDAIEQGYVPYSRGKEYLKQLIKLHTKFLLKTGTGGSYTLLDFDEIVSKIEVL
jgi:hypothetical protein